MPIVCCWNVQQRQRLNQRQQVPLLPCRHVERRARCENRRSMQQVPGRLIQPGGGICECQRLYQVPKGSNKSRGLYIRVIVPHFLPRWPVVHNWFRSLHELSTWNFH